MPPSEGDGDERGAARLPGGGRLITSRYLLSLAPADAGLTFKMSLPFSFFNSKSFYSRVLVSAWLRGGEGLPSHWVPGVLRSSSPSPVLRRRHSDGARREARGPGRP